MTKMMARMCGSMLGWGVPIRDQLYKIRSSHSQVMGHPLRLESSSETWQIWILIWIPKWEITPNIETHYFYNVAHISKYWGPSFKISQIMPGKLKWVRLSGTLITLSDSATTYSKCDTAYTIDLWRKWKSCDQKHGYHSEIFLST